jgi:hypothetical protein
LATYRLPPIRRMANARIRSVFENFRFFQKRIEASMNMQAKPSG